MMLFTMRTTLTLGKDVEEKAKKAAGRLGKSFKDVVNEALRLGLAAMEKPGARRYRLRPRKMTLKKGQSYDNIAELLARAEGEKFR